MFKQRLFLNIHFFQKPYHCCIDGCNKAYTDPSSLRKHIKRHHGDEVYESLKKNKTPYRRRRRNVKCVSDLENNSLSVSSPVYLDQKPVLSDILNFSQSSTGLVLSSFRGNFGCHCHRFVERLMRVAASSDLLLALLVRAGIMLAMSMGQMLRVFHHSIHTSKLQTSTSRSFHLQQLKGF